MSDEESVELDGVKKYRRRFVMATAIVFLYGLTFFQKSEYISIQGTITNYYKVSRLKLSHTLDIFPLIYIVFWYLTINFVELWGLRTSLIISASCNSFGAIIKCFAIYYKSFYLVLAAQTFVALSQTLLTTIYPLFVAVWFGRKEVATAKAFFTASAAAGVMTSLYMPKIVYAPEEADTFNRFSILLAIVCVVVFLFTIVVMEEKPRRAPSLAEKFKTTQLEWKSLFRNDDYVAMVVACFTLSLVVAIVWNSLESLALPFSVRKGLGTKADSFLYLPALFAPIFGYWLDTAKNFKSFANLAYFSVLFSVFLLWTGIPIASTTLAFLGSTLLVLTSSAFVATSSDLILEIVYPFSELRAIGFVQLILNLVALFAPYVAANVTTTLGAASTLFILLILLTIGFGAILSLNWDLRRENVESSSPLRNRLHDYNLLRK